MQFKRTAVVAGALLIAGCLVGCGPKDRDSPTQQQQQQQFSLQPVGDSSWIDVSHGSVPGGHWRLRISEYGYAVAGQPDVILKDVTWQPEANGAWSYSWAADPALKAQIGLDFWGKVTPTSDEHLDVELTATNVGSTRWKNNEHLMLFCLRAEHQTDFWDLDADNTFLRRNNQFVTVEQDLNGQGLPANKMFTIPKGNGLTLFPMRPSLDGTWTVGLATTPATNVSFNFSAGFCCIHSNPEWPNLDPGGSATIRARLYLIRGGVDATWQNYLANPTP